MSNPDNYLCFFIGNGFGNGFSELFRNFIVICSATFRYYIAHFVKNTLISSSGILIPHLSGSFLVIFP